MPGHEEGRKESEEGQQHTIVCDDSGVEKPEDGKQAVNIASGRWWTMRCTDTVQRKVWMKRKTT
jgi:hypothetical protein